MACTLPFGIGNAEAEGDRKSTRLNSSHGYISYAVFCLKKKKKMVDRLLLMGKQARSMISQAKRAFERRDVVMAQDVVRKEDLIYNMNKECVRIADRFS